MSSTPISTSAIDRRIQEILREIAHHQECVDKLEKKMAALKELKKTLADHAELSAKIAELTERLGFPSPSSEASFPQRQVPTPQQGRPPRLADQKPELPQTERTFNVENFDYWDRRK